MSVKREKPVGGVEVIAKYFLLFMLLSFFGWAFEVGIMFLQTGEFYDRGLLTLPVCPIYGGALFFTYFFLGTPQKGRGILKRVKSPLARCLLYAAFAFLIPTAAELIVGFFFDRVYHTWFWSYSGMPLNLGGYICIPVSLGWMIGIFLFMGLLFEPIKKGVFKLPKGLAITLATLLFIVTIFDFAASMSALS